MPAGQGRVPGRTDHRLDLPRAIRRAPAGELVLELHLDEHGHLHRGVDQFARAPHPDGLQRHDGAPEGEAPIDLREDLRRAFLAQIGPGEDLCDLLVEHAVRWRDQRRERQPRAVTPVAHGEACPGHRRATDRDEVGPELHGARRFLGHQEGAHPGIPVERVVVLPGLGARLEAPDRARLAGIDDRAARTVQGLGEVGRGVASASTSAPSGTPASASSCTPSGTSTSTPAEKSRFQTHAFLLNNRSPRSRGCRLAAVRQRRQHDLSRCPWVHP